MDSEQEITPNNHSNSSIRVLIEKLGDEDGMIRKSAREELVLLGRPAISYLAITLDKSSLHYIRWEAAKALADIKDISTIPVLVNALDDSNEEIVWIVAEALKKYKTIAWPKLLRKLVRNETNSVFLNRGVHHVLSNQEQLKVKEPLDILMAALEHGLVPETISLAAHNLLEALQVTELEV